MCWLEEMEARVPSSQFGSLYLVSCRGRKRLWTGLGLGLRLSVSTSLSQVCSGLGLGLGSVLFCSVLCAYLNLNNSVENPILKQ